MTTNEDNAIIEFDATPEQQAWVLNRTLGSEIRTWRECEAWSLEQAAQKLGISRQALHQYETGKKLPSVEQTIRLAEGLGAVPEMWLVYRIETELKSVGYAVDSFKIHKAS
jgi:transcriptional regulator with XRE-family HTH domain